LAARDLAGVLRVAADMLNDSFNVERKKEKDTIGIAVGENMG